MLEKATPISGLPVFGLAGSMATFERDLANVKHERNENNGVVSQDNINNVITDLIDVIGESIKTLLVFAPGEVIAKVAELTVFPMLVDVATSALKAQYLASLEDSKGFISEFGDQLFGNVDDMFSAIGKFLDGNVETADYSGGVISITDDEGNVHYYNETNNHLVALTDENNRLSNYGYGVTIDGGSRNDTVFSTAILDENTEIKSNYILGNSGDDFIIAIEDNVTIEAGNGDDILSATGNFAQISGGDGNDRILVEGDNADINGDAGNDILIVTGNGGSAYGGDGEDMISVSGSGVNVYGGTNFDALPVPDMFQVANTARNVVIKDFEKSADKLAITDGDIVVDTQIYADTSSFIILDAASNETIAVLQDVAESEFENITFTNQNGEVITTSINWLLANKKFSVPVNPYDQIKTDSGTTLSNVISGDSISNSEDGVVINAYGETTNIVNAGNNVEIIGGIGDDSITNRGENVTIDGGDSDDKISNEGINVGITGGSGDDSVYSNAAQVTIHGADGDDTIYNYIAGNDVVIFSDSGNNRITNNGDTVTIQGGSGNDSIYNYADNISIDGASGNDFIDNSGNNAMINTDDGEDYIRNNGSNVTINGGLDNDYISNLDDGNDVLIDGNDGNDTISNRVENVIIFGGDGYDDINNSASNVTINSNGGNDNISNNASNVIINGNEGSDIIHNGGGGHNVSIIGDDGDDSISSSGKNSTIDGGVGNDCIEIHGESIKVYSGEGNDSVVASSSSYSLIDCSVGNNFITIQASGVSGDESKYITVNAGTGNDYVHVVGSYHILINGMSGKNTIDVASESCSINGGVDADLIYDRGRYITLNAGNGNDTIVCDPYSTYGGYIGSHVLLYANGDGDDIIYKYLGGGLKVTSGIIDTVYANENNDVIIRVGSGSITLKDMAERHISFEDSSGKITHATYALNGDTIISYEMNFSTPLEKKDSDTYEYTGGNKVIENYSADEKLQMPSSITSVYVSENNLALKSGEGELTIEDARDNLIDITDTEGNITAQVYMSKDGGEVAANALGNSPEIFKVLVGASENTNHLIAGDGGASLFGGDTDDILEGGIGHNAFSYHSGNDTIKNYKSSDEIVFDGTYTDFAISDNDLVLNAAEGSLRIQDAKNKWIDVKDGNGDVLANFYLSSEGGMLDGRLHGGKTVLIGADNADNQIFAGDGNSTLWGGSGGTNVLVGGDGEDVFMYGSNDDIGLIQNAAPEDIINLYDLSIDDINLLSATKSGRKILLRLGTGAEMVVQTAQSSSPTFQDMNGTNWRYD